MTFWTADAGALSLAADRDEIPVARSPRAYADLIGFGARGLDAATHLKDEAIDPLHAVSREARRAGRRVLRLTSGLR